jgi:protein-disulfide isomerase
MKKSSVLLLVLGVLVLAGVAVAGVMLSGGTQKPASQTQAENVKTPQQKPHMSEGFKTVSYGSEVFGEGLTGTRSLGNPDAPIKVEEFASLTCGHCATFHGSTFPELKEKYIDTGKVFFTFIDFPLNAPALDASMIARCMPQERYFPFISMLFSMQERWAFDQNYRDLLRQNARLAGMNDNDFDSCLQNEDLKTGLVEIMQQAQKTHGINSTPSFVINGSKVMSGSIPLAAFEQAFEELSTQTTAE